MTPERSIRILLANGIALALAGLLAGMAMSWAADHEARLAMQERYESVFAAAARSAPAAADLARRRAASERYQRAVGVHAHAINMGLLAVLAALTAALAGEAARSRLPAAVLAGAVVLYPAGLLVQLIAPGPIGEGLAALGAAAAIAAFAVLAAGVLRAR